jgi:hypothetical protein
MAGPLLGAGATPCGARLAAVGCTPHFSFCEKRNGPCTVQRENFLVERDGATRPGSLLPSALYLGTQRTVKPHLGPWKKTGEVNGRPFVDHHVGHRSYNLRVRISSNVSVRRTRQQPKVSARPIRSTPVLAANWPFTGQLDGPSVFLFHRARRIFFWQDKRKWGASCGDAAKSLHAFRRAPGGAAPAAGRYLIPASS